MIDCSKCPKPGDCCGLFPMDKNLVEKNKDKFQVKPEKIIETENRVVVLTKDLLCVFLNRKIGKCEIYNQRPEVCKLYGISDDKRLRCPYFKRSGNRRSPGSQKQVEKYNLIMTKELMKEADGLEKS